MAQPPRRSWKSDIRPAKGESELKSTGKRAREAFSRMPAEDREAIEEWLMKAWILREANVDASDGALRDIAAGRRLALTFLNFVNGSDDDPGSRGGSRDE